MKSNLEKRKEILQCMYNMPPSDSRSSEQLSQYLQEKATSGLEKWKELGYEEILLEIVESLPIL